MDMVGGSAQSAVDSLLGRLSSLFAKEAQLLRNVHGDIQFIKREMESMNGFLLDADDDGRGTNQLVRVWRRQVHELAYASQSSVDRYVQTFVGAYAGAGAGLLASFRRAPELVRTLPTRHRIATEIRGLKARAIEVGERRQRYGVITLPRAGNNVNTRRAASEEGDDARRRRALDSGAALFDVDARAKEVVEWLMGKSPAVPRGRLRRNQLVTYGQLIKNLLAGREDPLMELIKLFRGLHGNDNPENVAEAAGYLRETMLEVGEDKDEELDRLLGGREDMYPHEVVEMIKAAKEPMEVARAEGRYLAARLRWLLHIFKGDFVKRSLYYYGIKVFVLVTPPVDGGSNEGEEMEELQQVEEMHATELARKAYNHPSASSHFDAKVWVNARCNRALKQRLMSILHQVLLLPGSPASSASHDHDNLEPTEAEKREWDGWSVAKLKDKIFRRLEGKWFLIVLADPEDENSWRDIMSALPDHGRGSIIVTPKIEHMAQFDGWCTASWLFSLMGDSSPYHVHLCSKLIGLRKVAAQLVGTDQLQGGISAILKKCLWDSFATRMFLHALYANPHRSDAELDRLLHGLSYDNSMGNARCMIRFGFDDLPKQYQNCLLSLSIFPQGQFKRASLVRRWAAENFVIARDALTAVDEAGRCFDALVARGLLEPVDIGAAGKVKSCTLHHHVLSFITNMAKRDAIIDNMDLPPDLAHRLSTRGGILHQLLENQAAANSKSCCCWGKIYGHSRTTPALGGFAHQLVTLLNLLPASSDQLGLVKLLDLEGCKGLKKRTLKNICDKIFQLIYLSLRNTDVTELPKEINKLRYLETLDIRQTKIESFPANTISLPKLMHLLAGRTDNKSLEAIGSDKLFFTVRLPSNIRTMMNMQVLSHVEISESDEDELECVGRKLHLRKLGVVIRGKHPLRVFCRVVGMLQESLCSLSVHLEHGQNKDEVGAKEEEGGEGHDFVIDTSDIPKSLESLNINGKINELPTWIRQLHRLCKITLSHTKLRGEDIQRLGELSNLRCVKLWHQSYTEHELTFNRSGFRKLEFLVIEDSFISNIQFAWGAAPKLEKIVWSFTSVEVTLSGIQRLPNLKEIHISGRCDETHFSKIKKDANENPNLPRVTPMVETNVVATIKAATAAS